MTPERLSECLGSIRWTPQVLAVALECDLALVEAWLDGKAEVPIKAHAWIQTLALAHQALEDGRPKSLKGKRFKQDRSPHDA
jgi:hypothetical protein